MYNNIKRSPIIYNITPTIFHCALSLVVHKALLWVWYRARRACYGALEGFGGWARSELPKPPWSPDLIIYICSIFVH